MESIYTELALYGSKNECAMTDNVCSPISEVRDGTVSLMEWWNDVMMEWCNDGLMEWLNDGMMDWWNDWMMEWWNNGMMEW